MRLKNLFSFNNKSKFFIITIALAIVIILILLIFIIKDKKQASISYIEYKETDIYIELGMTKVLKPVIIPYSSRE